uniref:Uncharacterized protein n=1 Tax=Chromera velia CCMP2878 TaxID=1169474 RepID=A0A0G4G7Y2_9ALVE|eukprot:Cvel_20673.t1-p1 / transcript=Cvel_20673.t1 / gene=Cvel_20673 / organism=Chromera_velia_CCMP2878 / gene_product=hypothetical protein / transcript_product=hypothetical protein / location=Cvel_scaffold1878:25747-28040(-) / protein_length=594 / sequence_SO=supercontig / SO=protein_coding / is_pseudo=false
MIATDRVNSLGELSRDAVGGRPARNSRFMRHAARRKGAEDANGEGGDNKDVIQAATDYTQLPLRSRMSAVATQKCTYGFGGLRAGPPPCQKADLRGESLPLFNTPLSPLHKGLIAGQREVPAGAGPTNSSDREEKNGAAEIVAAAAAAVAASMSTPSPSPVSPPPESPCSPCSTSTSSPPLPLSNSPLLTSTKQLGDDQLQRESPCLSVSEEQTKAKTTKGVEGKQTAEEPLEDESNSESTASVSLSFSVAGCSSKPLPSPLSSSSFASVPVNSAASSQGSTGGGSTADCSSPSPSPPCLPAAEELEGAQSGKQRTQTATPPPSLPRPRWGHPSSQETSDDQNRQVHSLSLFLQEEQEQEKSTQTATSSSQRDGLHGEGDGDGAHSELFEHPLHAAEEEEGQKEPGLQKHNQDRGMARKPTEAELGDAETPHSDAKDVFERTRLPPCQPSVRRSQVPSVPSQTVPCASSEEDRLTGEGGKGNGKGKGAFRVHLASIVPSPGSSSSQEGEEKLTDTSAAENVSGGGAALAAQGRVGGTERGSSRVGCLVGGERGRDGEDQAAAGGGARGWRERLLCWFWSVLLALRRAASALLVS